MAKVKVKEWVIFLVVATWLLTTLSACGSLATYPGQKNKAPQIQGKIVETSSNKCPDELWGSWGSLYAGGSGEVFDVDKVFSHSIDESGVESVTIEYIGGFGFIGGGSLTYVVDNKKRQASGYYYRARCDLKTERSGYRVLRIMFLDKQGSLTRMYDRFTTGNGLLYTQYYNGRLEKARKMSVMGKVK